MLFTAKLLIPGNYYTVCLNFNGFVTWCYLKFNIAANTMKYCLDNFAAVKIYTLWNGFIYVS